jgi:hypothetical protein
MGTPPAEEARPYAALGAHSLRHGLLLRLSSTPGVYLGPRRPPRTHGTAERATRGDPGRAATAGDRRVQSTVCTAGRNRGPHTQAIRRCGLRQCPYIGQAKTHLQHVLTATALNLVRAVAWLEETPRATTRRSTLRGLARAYETVADACRCHFLDASRHVRASAVDGVHLDLEGHRALALAVKNVVAASLTGVSHERGRGAHARSVGGRRCEV